MAREVLLSCTHEATLLCCRLQDLIQPMMEPGGQGFVDLKFGPDGALVPESARVWQFAFTLVSAEGVGPTGE